MHIFSFYKLPSNRPRYVINAFVLSTHVYISISMTGKVDDVNSHTPLKLHLQ